MRKIRQHIPGYVDGTPSEIEFETLEQLMAIRFVREWRRAHPNFYRFSIAREGLLMAEYSRGRRFWVVGFIDDPAGLDLPVWNHPQI